MAKFKVGDRIIGKTIGWTYGVYGTIIELHGKYSFLISFDEKVSPSFKRKDNLFCAYQTESEIEKIIPKKSIHIYTDGVTTTAKLCEGKQTIRTATAKCNPEDEFKFEVGATIAYERLINSNLANTDFHREHLDLLDLEFKYKRLQSDNDYLKTSRDTWFAERNKLLAEVDRLTAEIKRLKSEQQNVKETAVREVKRPAKAGEYIKIVKVGSHGPELNIGDIHRVTKATGANNYYTVETDRGNTFCGKEHDEYIIFETHACPDAVVINGEVYRRTKPNE